MFKTLAVAAMVTSLVVSQCSEGCLICDKVRGKCRYCDSTLNYITLNGRCVFRKLAGCEMQSARGECLMCAQSFFLDPISRTCAPVRPGRQVDNCATYNQRFDCVECNTGYYLNKKVCTAVPAQISNCQRYAADGRACAACARGYVPDGVGAQCVAVNVSNCVGYSSVDCLSCAPGYIRNPNAYLYAVSQPGPVQAHLIERFAKVQLNAPLRASLPMCQPLSVPKCVEFATFNTCRVCDSKFFLDEQLQCVPNPISRIPNCLRYSSPTVCIECAAGMYIKSDGECAVPAIAVPDCQTYDSTATKISCLKCNQGFFLSEPNVCSKRTVLSVIANCDTISDTSETCLKCTGALVLTSDGGACLSPVANCLTYQTSSSTSTALVCSKCRDKYYYDLAQSKCVKGSKDYCVEYEVNSNSCKTCLNKFYTLNGVCKPHDELYLCDKYDRLNKNSCQECKSSAFLFTRQDSCVPVVPIDFCVVYATTTTCQVCADNYVLNASKRCDLIPISENCIQKNVVGQCVKCHANYVLDNGVCKNFDDETLFFCDSHNLDGVISPSQLKCNYCRNSAIPFNYKNLYSCVHGSLLPPAVVASQTCEQFDGAGQCRRCRPTHVLLDGTCVTACDPASPKGTLYLYILAAYDSNGDGVNDSYAVVSNRECSLTLPNCAVAAPDLNQPDPTIVRYTCVECAPGALAKINWSASATTSRRVPGPARFRNSPVSFVPGFDCVVPSASMIIPTVRPLINGGVDNCEYYTDVGAWFGCMKCRHGHSGVVIDNIFGCKDYNASNLCIRCQHGYWLKSANECGYVTPVPNCEVYYNEGTDACVQCRDDFFLSGSTSATNFAGNTVKLSSTCALRTTFKLGCLRYATFDETCTECEPGRYLSNAGDCPPVPANCKTVTAAGACTACENGFFLSAGVCFKGEVQNCKTYADVAPTANPAVPENVCATCVNGFYLDSNKNTCVAHLQIGNCETASQSVANTCDVCAPNHFRFAIHNKCVPYIAIANCAEYTSVYECARCADGFYLANYKQRCLAIPASSGCTQMTGANCSKCRAGFYLNNNNCLNYFADVLQNCDTSLGLATDGLQTAQLCAYCKTTPANTFEPIDLIDQYRCVEKDVVKASNGNPVLIDNCKRYTKEDGTLRCVSCETPFVLATDKLSCIAAEDCFAANKVVYLATYASTQSSSAHDSLQRATDAICDVVPNGSTGLDHCYLASDVALVSGATTIPYACAKCRNGYVATIVTATPAWVSMKNIGETPSAHSYYPSVTCADPSGLTVTGTVNNKNMVSNCEYYIENGNANTAKCFKCRSGYRGVVQGDYINACEPYADCDTGKSYYGITTKTSERVSSPHSIATMFTCHACTAAAKKPVIYADLGAASDQVAGLVAWNNNAGYDQECADATVQNTPVYNKFTVTDCALYAVNVRANVNANTDTVFCVACAPGFVPTARSNWKITQCTAGSTLNMVDAVPPLFNGGACADGYAFKYTFSGGVDSTGCDSHPDPLCFAANSANSKCDVCDADSAMNGTTLKCERVTPPLCTQLQSSEKELKALAHYALYLARQIPGCASCSGGKVPVKRPKVVGSTEAAAAFKVCTNKTPASTVVVPAIDNCTTVRYNIVNSKYQCTVCNNGWIVTEDGECASAALNPNCSLVTTKAGTFCRTCINNTISRSGVCVSRSIANCDTYKDSSALSYIRCDVCRDNFYEKFDFNMQVSTCEDATALRIYNCASYLTTDDLADPNAPKSKVTCARCAANYFRLIPGANNDPVCHPTVPEIADCAEYDAGQLVNGNLQCSKCVASTLKVPNGINGFVKSVCVPFNGDPKCVQWTFGNSAPPSYTLGAATFACTKCVDEYYVHPTTSICVPRTVAFNGTCRTLNLRDDKCDACLDNYFLNPSKTACVPTPAIQASPAAFFGFLSACSPMDACLPDVIDGLAPRLAALLSCHKCAESTRLPFLVVKGGFPYDRILGLQSYNLNITNLALGYDMISYGESTTCLEPAAATFNIPSGAFNFPENCAVGVLNANAPPDASHGKTGANVDLKKIAVFCGACAPGFKATGATTLNALGASVAVPSMISRCDAIANCESSTWFNYCSQCSSGYSYGYSAATGIQYDSCAANNGNKWCLAFDAAAGVCVACQRGAFLNKDGHCEKLRQPRCLQHAFLQPFIYALADMSTALSVTGDVAGCLACERGFFPILRAADLFVCTESSYQARQLAPPTTKYIYKCNNYFVDANGVLKCNSCQDKFIPLNGNGSCIDASSLQYCKIAANSVTCKECYPGNVLVNRICVPQNIDSCVRYGNNDQSTEQICIGCAEGYYLEANRCKLGNVMNCLLYETQTRCNQCKNGFQLVIRDDGANYCYPIDPQLKCSAYDSDFFQKAILKCATCASNTLIVSQDPTTYNPNYCLRYSQIRNCVQYDLRKTIASIADSTFGCIKCLRNFYLKAGICAPRTFTSPTCAEYDIAADRCKVCVNGMYLDTDGRCAYYPSGIPSCTGYSSPTKCTGCAEGFYLSNNECMQVPVAQKIDKCVLYETATACKTCEPGYLISEQICVKILATNCLTAKSPSQCGTCQPGWVLKTDGDNLSCVQASIDNCSVYEVKEPIRCITCRAGYYANNGVCTAVAALIPRCLEYDSATTCARCESNTALAIDKTLCDTTTTIFEAIDPFCTNSAVQKQPFCALCQAGYFLNQGACTPCAQLATGCYMCDPANNALCLVCAQGYFMDKKGNCNKYVPALTDAAKVVAN